MRTSGAPAGRELHGGGRDDVRNWVFSFPCWLGGCGASTAELSMGCTDLRGLAGLLRRKPHGSKAPRQGPAPLLVTLERSMDLPPGRPLAPAVREAWKTRAVAALNKYRAS